MSLMFETDTVGPRLVPKLKWLCPWEAVIQKCSVKKVLLEISQNLQENTCVRVCNFIKRFWHRCFPVNFAKFLITPFLTEHLQWPLLMYLLFWCGIRTLTIFCPWKRIKNIYEINQHWAGNYPRKCCPNKLIYIKALCFVLTIICRILFFLKRDILPETRL